MVDGPNQSFEGAVSIRGQRRHSALPFAVTHRDFPM
jgi:hypothetical protein